MYSCITYWLIGYNPQADHFIIYIVVVVLISNCGVALGIFIASVIPDLQVALLVAPLVLLPVMLFGGLFVNNSGIPAYFDWIKYISPVKYGFEALAKNEFYGLTFYCDGVPDSKCPITTGEQALQQLSLLGDGLTVAICTIALASMYTGLLIVALLGLFNVVRRNFK